jgi:hypothetical protein
MAWWIQALEIEENGKPTGRFRLTATSDEDGGGPFALCDCENGHATREEAAGCPIASDAASRF